MDIYISIFLRLQVNYRIQIFSTRNGDPRKDADETAERRPNHSPAPNIITAVSAISFALLCENGATDSAALRISAAEICFRAGA